MWEGNVPLTIVKYKAEGLQLAQFRTFYDNPVQFQTRINQRLSAEKLENNEGYDIYHMTVKSPSSYIIAHRSSFVCYYRRELEDGGLNVMNSSLGNENYEEQCKEQIGSNVVA